MILVSLPCRVQVLRLTSLAAVLLLTACAAPKPHRAPVEDRTVAPADGQSTGAHTAEPRASASAEPARPGTYVVKQGDTLLRIALDHGLSWRDLARWNALDNPNLIEVGQVLRTVPPQAVAAAASPADGLATRPVVSAVKPETKPLDARSADGKSSTLPLPVAGAASAVVPVPMPVPVAVAPPAAAASANGEGEIGWAWPSPGALIASFDEQRNKGIGIGGKAGDAVLAAADGRVMYAGSGLRGYGNMVIIKHNETYLSAYAHNQTVLVKEDQLVRKGQRIAEMGSSDADQVKLHFEIRRKGKPVDPAKLLPPR
ncbi:peptidoglycan DD-metalloendopeptidase family protein [Inhella sp.]|uniref:peptidoglycan DD-metalloendopeptidase family protein n=1 Tax=Inhella sp. TaxID=1921806 RepID=UPI0035B280D1